jgi:hypothetical protein
MLALIGAIAREIPCYTMEFDRSGRIVPELEDLVRRRGCFDKAST